MPCLSRCLGLVAVLLVAGVSPVLAASSASRAFLANLIPNVDFLDRSSRFALDNSKNARLRAFALSEAREQTRAADALYDWTLANAHPMTASTAPAEGLDKTPTGSIKPAWPAFAPTDGKAGGKTDDRVPLGQEDIDSLEGLEGQAFDAEYKEKQRGALEQVEADYRDYLAKGDDLALLVLAKRELPRITKRRASLGKI